MKQHPYNSNIKLGGQAPDGSGEYITHQYVVEIAVAKSDEAKKNPKKYCEQLVLIRIEEDGMHNYFSLWRGICFVVWAW